MATRLELYEALKPTLGAEAARMVADSVPESQNLATKDDIALSRAEWQEFRVQMTTEWHEFRAQMTSEWDEFRLQMTSEWQEFRAQMTSEWQEFRAQMTSEFQGFRSEMRSEFQEHRAETQIEFQKVRQEIAASAASTQRWMLTFFVPLWLGVWAMVVALAVKL